MNRPKSGKRFRFVMRFANPASMPDDVALLAGRCAHFLGCAGAAADEANAVEIALEELLTNIAKFGAGGENPPPLLAAEGAVEVEAGAIRLVLSDNGSRFDPAGHPQPDVDAPPERRPVGGLGLHMLFQMFDRHEHRWENGRNINVWTLRRKNRESAEERNHP